VSARENEAPDVASFYHLRGVPLEQRACAGTACFVARRLDPNRWANASTEPRVYCLGKCYASPAAAQTSARPAVGVTAPHAIVLERVARGGARQLSEYAAAGGYQALERARSMTPDAVIRELEVSGLRGRGGAGFPTGKKLRAVASQRAGPKYVVMNADEGDSGAYIDRFLLEDDPFALLEGLSIVAHAVGATKGFIYLRREYPEALTRLQAAIAEAAAARVGLEVELVVGDGSYVCGEETALLNSLEGRRPFVRSRPPFPSEKGLFGHPTLVQNVETLASIPWIISHGGQAYAALGFSLSRGTKVVSLNSLFAKPGLYEVEFGTPVREIVEGLGGGLATGTLRGVIIGGPVAGVLPPRQLDAPFAFEELHALGASVGHGGVVAFDEHTSALELVHHVFSFGASESCGRCTPCRLGARHVERMAARAVPWDLQTFEALVSALQRTSLCGHGSGLGEFAQSMLRHYREELLACFGS
jgi:NADH:ubiquinone oxidoreductase subunit F (NADH-binding)